jgi:hypothetical protein
VWNDLFNVTYGVRTFPRHRLRSKSDRSLRVFEDIINCGKGAFGSLGEADLT